MKSLFSCSMIFYCPKSRNLLVEYQAPFFYTLYISVISLFHCCVCLVYILPVTQEVTDIHGVKKYDFNETKINKCWA